MKLVKILSNQRIFAKLLLPFILFTGLAIIVGNYIYTKTTTMTKTNAKQTMLYTLEHCKNLLDMQLKDLEKTTSLIETDYRIRGFLNSDQILNNSDYYKMYQIMKVIKSPLILNSFVSEMYIIFKHQNVIICSNNASTRVSEYYDSFLKYNNMDYISWYNKIFSSYIRGDFWPAQSIFRGEEEVKEITFIRSFPKGNYSNWKGTFIVTIDENEIYKSLQPVFNYQEAKFCLIGKDNVIISSRNMNDADNLASEFEGIHGSGFVEMEINNEDMTVAYIESYYNGWMYIAAVPNRVLMTEVEYLTRIFNIGLIILIIIGLTIAIIYLYRNILPLKAIAQKAKRLSVNTDGTSGNEFQIIARHIDYLSAISDRLLEEKRIQLPLIKDALFERLFRGSYKNEKEIEVLLSYLDIQILCDQLIVALVKMDMPKYDILTQEILNTLNSQRQIIVEMFAEKMGKKTYYYAVNNDKIAFLITLDTNKTYESLSCEIESIVKKLDTGYKIGVLVGVGNKCERLMDVCQSFQEACQALEYSVNREQDMVMCFSNIINDNQNFSYSIDTESRLINLVMMGESEEVEKILRMVYSNNFEKTELCIDMSKQLLAVMAGTLTRLEDELVRYGIKREELKKNMEGLNFSKPFAENYEIICNAFISMCHMINERNASQSNMLTQQILDYINQNYDNMNLSLAIVSDEFKITEKYLSLYFKQKTGENFSVYLEKLRLKKACTYLKEYKDMSIEEIAGKVGYYSSNTFYRAFKRVYNNSPSTYRERSQYCD